ncbi:homoserine O-acetyltransferase family protein [Flexivirga meconopsidis]|uniref:homoserine O-acetyltransferase family protein n=1 Tax=Flexivirga meconopsidis TaxID=2977121 RepID=UPI00223F3F39
MQTTALNARGSVALPAPLTVDDGSVLDDVAVGYESWGALTPERDNLVVVCHSLTKGAHAAAHDEDDTAGWWEAAIGPGRMIDTDHWCVIAFDALGSGGTTGPSTPHPSDGAPYGSRWPRVTVHDIVRSCLAALDALDICSVHAVIGGCFGGQQALGWALLGGDRVRSVIPIAVTAATSAHSIALFSVLRQMITSDPKWRNGDYPPDDPPTEGVGRSLAAAIPLWMSRATFEQKFGRQRGVWDGETCYASEVFVAQVVERSGRGIDARSLVSLTRTVDDFDLRTGHGDLAAAFGPVSARLLVVAYENDWRYPVEECRQVHEAARVAGVHSRFLVIDNPTGHGAFMYDLAELSGPVRDFLHAVRSERDGCDR